MVGNDEFVASSNAFEVLAEIVLEIPHADFNRRCSYLHEKIVATSGPARAGCTQMTDTLSTPTEALRRQWDTSFVLGHVGLNVPDLEEARAYYSQVMPLLGFELFISSADEFAFMPAGGKHGTYLFVYPAAEVEEYSRHRPGLQHLAFMVPTRSAVRSVHALIVRLDNEVVLEPQDFPQYPPPYFATFWLDPFGFMFEAVCHHDRP